MFKFLDKLADRMQLRGMQQNEVGRIDGIVLATTRPRQKLLFHQTVEQSLKLIRDHDPRRYARITRHFGWIFNSVLRKGTDAVYLSSTRTCVINFHWLPGADNDMMAAFYACIFVHESTHGVIESRKIQYRGEDRIRIERLCVTEQNRFAAKLAAAEPIKYPLRLLQIHFDENLWKKDGLLRGISLFSHLPWNAKAE